MRHRVFPLLIVSGAVVSACLGADNYEVKVYPCPKATAPITVDGAVDEPAWQQAPLVGRFTYYNKPEPAEVQTFLRVLFDERFLYVAVLCDEPLMKQLTPVAQGRDTHMVFHGETIELFVDPNHDHRDYYQIAVNAAGSIYDSRRTDPTWSAEVRAKTRLGKDRWTMEVAIPWSDLGVTPKPGTVVGFNACRDRHVGHDRQWSNWSQTEGNFHDPIRFGHLVPAGTPEMLGTLGAEFRKGDRRGAIAVYSQEGFAQTTYRALAKRSIAKLEAMLADLAQAHRMEKDAKTKAELGKRIEAYRREIAPFHRQIEGSGALDAAAWTRMEHRITAMTKQLEQGIWDARLSALLSGI